MDRNGLLLVLLLLFMIGFGRSNALNSRKLGTTKDPIGSSNANQDSPLSSPPPDEKKQNPPPDAATEPKNTPTKNPSDDDSKSTNDVDSKTGSKNSSDKKLDKEKGDDGKEKTENETQLKPFAIKDCKGNPICSDQEKTMIACIQDFENGSNNLTVLVHNERGTTLKVNITLGASMNEYLPAFELPRLGTKKVNITLSGDKTTNISLNSGNGDCKLVIGRPKTIPVDDPTKTKDPDNNSNPKPADDPAKPKDKVNPSDGPVKPKEIDDPAKTKPAETPVKPIDDPAKTKPANTPVKPKEDDDPTKVKNVDGPKKSPKDPDDAKSKNVEDPEKSKGTGSLPKSEIMDVPTGVDSPVSGTNLLDQLSFYSKQVTPIYGAYFAFLVALVIGGSWAMCSCRKRRTDGGVAYQELEMGLPESSNAVDVETAEGWDQDWDDDDWDEDKAIRSPGGGVQTRTISSNGLTSRSSKKDGWDADWDN